MYYTEKWLVKPGSPFVASCSDPGFSQNMTSPALCQPKRPRLVYCPPCCEALSQTQRIFLMLCIVKQAACWPGELSNVCRLLERKLVSKSSLFQDAFSSIRNPIFQSQAPGSSITASQHVKAYCTISQKYHANTVCLMVGIKFSQ